MSSAGLNLPLWPCAGYILTVWQRLETFFAMTEWQQNRKKERDERERRERE